MLFRKELSKLGSILVFGILGLKQFLSEYDFKSLLIGHIIPEIARAIVFTAIAISFSGFRTERVIAGIMILASLRSSLSMVSGIPVQDDWSRVAGKTMLTDLSTIIYMIRSVPYICLAIVDSLIAGITALIMTSSNISVLDFIIMWFVASLSAVSTVPIGLIVGLFSLGNNYQNFLHNAIYAIMVVISGSTSAGMQGQLSYIFPSGSASVLYGDLSNGISFTTPYWFFAICLNGLFWFIICCISYMMYVKKSLLKGARFRS